MLIQFLIAAKRKQKNWQKSFFKRERVDIDIYIERDIDVKEQGVMSIEVGKFKASAHYAFFVSSNSV